MHSCHTNFTFFFLHNLVFKTFLDFSRFFFPAWIILDALNNSALRGCSRGGEEWRKPLFWLAAGLTPQLLRLMPVKGLSRSGAGDNLSLISRKSCTRDLFSSPSPPQKLNISGNHKKFYYQFVVSKVEKTLQNLRSESAAMPLVALSQDPGG